MPATTPAEKRPWRIGFVAVFLLVTTLTHLPRVTPLGPEHVPPDKLMHFCAFGLMALLLARARWMPAPLAMLCMIVWVPLDEWTQHLVSPHRHTEMADIIGGWMGVIATTMLLAAMRPPGHMADIWGQSRHKLDCLIGAPRAGLRATIVAGVVGAIMLPSLYVPMFLNDWRHPGTLATFTTLLACTGLWMALFHQAWNTFEGPPLCHIRLGWWLVACATGFAAFLVGAGIGEIGLPGLGTPSALLVAVGVLSMGLRRALCSHWRDLLVDESEHG